MKQLTPTPHQSLPKEWWSFKVQYDCIHNRSKSEKLYGPKNGGDYASFRRRTH